MADQETRPLIEETDPIPQKRQRRERTYSRWLLPLGLGLLVFIVGCFWWSSAPPPAPITEGSSGATTTTQATMRQATATPVVVSRPSQSSAALTRVASSLAQAPDPTATATAVVTNSTAITATDSGANSVANGAEIPLPTVTPTLVPQPVATRTVEFGGEAMLRLQLNREDFESNGQPVTIAIEPRSYVLGGDTLKQNDQWCMQVGPTGLVFDLQLALQPVTEDLHIGGELQLYDGFCGTWGNLGSRLSTVPVDITVPTGTVVQVAPTLQVRGNLLGLDNLLNITTGVFLELTIRNPNPN